LIKPVSASSRLAAGKASRAGCPVIRLALLPQVAYFLMVGLIFDSPIG
jgi:hypothetical protein